MRTYVDGTSRQRQYAQVAVERDLKPQLARVWGIRWLRPQTAGAQLKKATDDALKLAWLADEIERTSLARPALYFVVLAPVAVPTGWRAAAIAARGVDVLVVGEGDHASVRVRAPLLAGPCRAQNDQRKSNRPHD